MADVKSWKLQIKNNLCRKQILHLSTSILKECHIKAPSYKCIMGAKNMRKAVH